MKKNYLRLLAVIISIFIYGRHQAQLSGIYTIDNGSPTGGTNYNNFTDFANDINTNGVSAPVVVNVAPGTGPYIEQILLNQIQGASATNNVVINGNNNLLTFSSSSSSMRYVLGLNGTDFLTVNDLNIQGTGTYAYPAFLYGGANSNVFANCTFSVPVQGTSSNQIPVVLSGSGSSYASSGNSGSNNRFEGCTMSGGYMCVSIYGMTSAPYNSGNAIVNCSINDFYYGGIYLYYAKDALIKGNTIERLNKTIFTTSYGIFLIYNNGAVIENNRIQKLFNAMPTSGSTAYGIYGYYNPSMGSNVNVVRNNIISDIRSNGALHGIYYYYPGGIFEHNTISLDDALTTGSNTNYGIYTYGNSSYPVTLRNNIITITRGGSGSKYGLYVAVNGNITSDFNDIYVNSSGTNFVGYYGGALTSLTQFQSAGLEMNSVSIDPIYTSITANNLYPTNAALNNLAEPNGVIFDADMNVRNPLNPDMGALEFLTPNCSGSPSSNGVSAPAYSICPGETVELGLTTLNSSAGFSYQWQQSSISNVGPFTPIIGATSLFYTAPSVTANTWYSVIMTCTLPGGGSISPVGQVMVSGPTVGSVPYYESFEGIGKHGRLPNCTWVASDVGMSNLTYTSSQSNNRIANSGTGFASFSNMNPGTSEFYTHPIQLDAGITYSTGLFFTTEYFGYGNWTDLSIWMGPNQTYTNMVQLVSEAPAISGPYKLISNTFSVTSSGLYYFAIRATSSSGNAVYLTWDDFFVTIPCNSGSPNLPQLSVNASNTLICAGDPVALTANGADTYSWSSGASGNSISESPTSNVLFTVYGTNTLTGCVATAAVQVSVNPKPNVFVVANSPIVCSGEPVTLSAYGANSYAWNTGAVTPVTVVTPTTNTTYTVIGVNVFGCAGQFVQQVAVNNLPNVTVLSNFPQEACAQELVQLTATGASTFSWTSNVTSQVYQGNPIFVIVPATSIFTVTGTDANGCSNLATITQNISECTGIAKQNSTMGLSVSPNPSHDVFTVNLGKNTPCTILVMDVTGRILYEMDTQSSSHSVDLSSLAQGVYYLRVVAHEKSDVVKIVRD